MSSPNCRCTSPVHARNLVGAWTASRDVPPPTRAGVTVDDDLVDQLAWTGSQAVSDAMADPYGSYIDHGQAQDFVRGVLASEPMQRLKAAWTAETDAETVRQAFDVVKLRADNASLHAQVDGRLRDNDVAAEALKKAWRERDEARAGLSRTERERDAARADYPRFISIRDELQGRVDALDAEVERLRAAVPDLSDVGPVTIHAHGSLEPFECLVVDGTHFVRTDGSDHLRRVVAVYLTAAAEIDRLDREAEDRAAADTATDDDGVTDAEVEAAQDYLGGECYVIGDDTVRGVLAAAHRDRTHEEGGR